MLLLPEIDFASASPRPKAPRETSVRGQLATMHKTFAGFIASQAPALAFAKAFEINPSLGLSRNFFRFPYGGSKILI
jgi:hypothetical protein